MLSRAEKLAKRRLAPPKDREGHGFSYRRPSHQVADNAMPPPLGLKPDARPSADVRAIQALDLPPQVPPSARLTMAQMAEIERLAALRLNLFQIGVQLRIERDTWAETVRCNPQVAQVYTMGAVRAVIEHSEVARELALEDRDPGMVKLWLQQHGGPQWSPKARVVVARDDGPVDGLDDGVDVTESVNSSAEEQRELLGLLGSAVVPKSEE